MQHNSNDIKISNSKTEQKLENIKQMTTNQDKCKEIAQKILNYIKNEKP